MITVPSHGSVNASADSKIGYRSAERSIIMSSWASVLFSVLGFGISFLSCWNVSSVVVNLNDFLGLTSHIPPWYWVGLAFSLASLLQLLRSESPEEYKLVISSVSIVSVLMIPGIVMESNPRGDTVYWLVGMAKLVLSQGRIPSPEQYPNSYMFWPGYNILGAFLISTSGANPELLVLLMPVALMIEYALMMFAIGKAIGLQPKERLLLSVLSVSLFWTDQLYFSPQVVSFLLFLVAFFAIFSIMRPATRSRIGHVSYLLILFLATFMMTLYHALSPVAGALFLGGIAVLNRKMATYFMIALVALFAWNMSWAYSFFEKAVSIVLQQFERSTTLFLFLSVLYLLWLLYFKSTSGDPDKVGLPSNSWHTCGGIFSSFSVQASEWGKAHDRQISVRDYGVYGAAPASSVRTRGRIPLVPLLNGSRLMFSGVEIWIQESTVVGDDTSL